MYLSKLRIFGFKSFANKVEVNFPGDGITAVVGPNGCGKSNIIDSIRWVLGEQRARALRGAKMEDVIFSGTADRPALNMAEVSLVVRNDKGVLPSEYAEIMITRRAYRDGSTEYLINNQPCRLRDIHNLFYDTGLGAASYSVMESRMIDSLLSNNPEERRSLFEEAAGISRYRNQRKEAIRQMDKTAVDLQRVQDNLSAVRRSAATYERQAKLAETWRTLSTRLKSLDLSWLASRREEAKGRIAEFEKATNDAKAESESLRTEIVQAETNAQGQRLEANRLEEELRIKERELADARAEIQAVESDRLRAQDALGHIASSRRRVQEDLQALEETELDLGGRESRAREELATSINLVESLGSELETLREDLATRERRLEILRSSVAEEAQARLESVEALSRAREEAVRTENTFKAALREVERLDEELERLQTSRDELTGRREALRQAVTSATADIESLAAEQATLVSEQERLQKDLEELVDAEKKAGQARASAQSQLDVLERLQKSLEGVSSGPKALLQGDHRAKGLRGMVASSLRTSPELLEVVEQCLGDALQWVIADSQACAGEAIDGLASHGQGMATILPLGSLDASHARRPELSGEGFVGWASDLVDCDGDVRPAIDLLLSRIAVTTDAEAARRLQAQHRGADVWFATAGLRLHGTGIVSGGKGSGKEMGLLRRAQLAEDFAKALEEAKHELEALGLRRTSILQSRQAQEGRRREIEPALHDARRREAAAQGELRQLENQAETMESRCRQSMERVEELRRGLDALESVAERATREVDMLAEERAVRDSAASRAEEARREAEDALTELRDQLRETQMRQGTAQADIRRWEAELDSGERRMAEIAAARERLKTQDEGFEGQVEERTSLMEQLAGEVERMRETYRLQERGRDQAKEVYDAAVLAVEDKLSGVKGHQRRLEELGRHLHAAELVKAQAESEIKSLSERAFQAYEVDIDDDQAWEPVSFDPGMVAAEVEELRQKLKGLGPINPAALEEFEAERARLEDVQKQYDDLEKAKNGLERAIKRLDKLARDKFVETFTQVQKNFQQVFSSLFGGGEAKIELEEGVDPLEARIEINARPLGKAMRGVALLSGGERALTATSLLFALYLIRPSPYCILDEVDGPLDDANIGRFVDLLRKFSHQTQFIVVTHNKRTMAASDMLYGVTQEIKGISQLASVQLDEAERFAA